jgi:Fur family ferric uptake transcriptional regulator
LIDQNRARRPKPARVADRLIRTDPLSESFQINARLRPLSPDFEALPDELRARGLRVTAARVAVYRSVAESAGHPDVETIATRARELIGTLSTQTVYDTLHTLTGAGLLRRIEPAGSPARFESRVADNHHHVVCRACGAAHDIDCVEGAAPCIVPGDAGGFVVDEAEVTFWGLCPSCQGNLIPEHTERNGVAP